MVTQVDMEVINKAAEMAVVVAILLKDHPIVEEARPPLEVDFLDPALDSHPLQIEKARTVNGAVDFLDPALDSHPLQIEEARTVNGAVDLLDPTLTSLPLQIEEARTVNGAVDLLDPTLTSNPLNLEADSNPLNLEADSHLLNKVEVPGGVVDTSSKKKARDKLPGFF